MPSPMVEFDHAVIRVNDLIVAERFYRDVFSGIYGPELVNVEHTSTCTVEELLHLSARGGPGTRRAEIEREKFGRDREERDPTARIAGTPQGTVHIGEALIPLFLARRHDQEPPPEQMRGQPRHSFPASPEQMEKAIAVLRSHRVPFEGPVDHPEPALVAQSIYFKDPSSNFLEICIPRDPEAYPSNEALPTHVD